MSQHTVTSFHEGQPVTILMGWDRALQGFFMVIEHQSREGPLYSNLDDPGLVDHRGLPPTIEPFARQLQTLQIEVPLAMLEAVELDGILDVGNRFVDHGVVRAGGPQ